MFWNIFRRKEMLNPRERDFYRDILIKSLQELIKDTEVRVVEYHGPSEEFVNFAADHSLSFTMGESSRYGSIAKLARNELEFLFRKPNLTLEERYWAGIALGYTPKEILNYHRFPLKIPGEMSGSAEQLKRTLKDRRQETSLSPEHLREAGIDVSFNAEYPGASPYRAFKLCLQRTNRGYQVQEITA
jgi:hypothetical protein